MRRTMIAMLAGLLLLPAFTAADKPAAPSEQLEALKKEVEKSWTEYPQAYEKAKTDKERQELSDKNNKEIRGFARRALKLAQKHPKDPVAVDALVWMITGGTGFLGRGGPEIETAFDLLRKDYVTSDKLQGVCGFVVVYDSVSTKPDRFLRAVVEKNPHREIQAEAYYSLARHLRRHASWAKQMRDPANAKRWEGPVNEELARLLKTSDSDKLLKESEDTFERVVSRYGDVKSPLNKTYGELAKAALFEMRHLAIGKRAPEIEGEDIDGKHFKLSDYRGKVVVLDFWGNW